MKVSNQGSIYLYKVEWGTTVDVSNPDIKRKCYKSIRDDLNNTLGRHITYDNFIYST